MTNDQEANLKLWQSDGAFKLSIDGHEFNLTASAVEHLAASAIAALRQIELTEPTGILAEVQFLRANRASLDPVEYRIRSTQAWAALDTYAEATESTPSTGESEPREPT